MFRFLSASCLLFVITFSSVLFAADEKYWEYTFKPGDTIWKIAERYTSSVNNWVEIQRINKIRQGSDRKIRPGTRIVVPVHMLKLQPTPAQVIAISHGVSLLRANGDIAEISIGTLLFSGDRVVTGSHQNLRIQLADNSELQILENTEVVFDKLSHHKLTGMIDTRIRLNSGSINTSVKHLQTGSRYEIKTPAAITAVRGTAFRLSADSEQRSRTEVTKGVVEVLAGDSEQRVNHGYGIIAEKGKALSEPVKLLAAPRLSNNLTAEKNELIVAWQKLDAAILYRFQLASDDKFNDIIINDSTKENITRIINLQPGYYYFRVRGVDLHHLEGFDSVDRYNIEKVRHTSAP